MKYNKTCRKGFILRNAYTRHLKKKNIRVKSGCIKSQSQFGIKRSTLDKAIIRKKNKTYRLIRKKFGTPKCKNDEVVREGYTRRNYKHKNGEIVRSTIVPPGCIKAVGLSKKRGVKGQQLFVLQKGLLTKYGYHFNKSETERHSAINKALKHIKPLSVYRKINALYVLNKNKSHTQAIIYKNDADWVKNTSEYRNRNV